jgi:hypothetical protein
MTAFELQLSFKVWVDRTLGRSFVRKLLSGVVAISLPAFIGAAYAQETSHYEVVAEYIRQLGAINSIQETMVRELSEATNPPDGIPYRTKLQQELRTGINAFKAMKLAPPHGALFFLVINFYEQKIRLHDALHNVASQTIVESPNSAFNNAKLAASAPKLTADLENIDKALFDATPLFFALLLDQEPDKQGHVSRLVITKAQRSQLVDKIDGLFGKSLNDKDQSYATRTASLLKLDLLKEDYKNADEPL